MTLKQALVATDEIMDVGIGVTTQFVHGGWAQNMFNWFKVSGLKSKWYGWAGWGGSIIRFNPELDVVFCYTMTGMENSLTGDKRTLSLIAAMESCLLKNGVLADHAKR